MMNATHAASLIAALVLGWSLARAQDPEETETETREVAVGLEYLELYHAGKIEEMRPFFTETSLFEDPTAEAMGSVFSLTGGDQIVSQLSALFAAQDPEYRPALEFQSGRFAVSAGAFAYDVPGAMAGSTEKSVRVELQVTSIVEFDGDHVVRHADYGDYTGMMAELSELKERNK